MKVAHKFLHKPVEITVTPASSTVDNIDQKLYTLPKKDKKRLLEHIIETTKIKSAVIFTRTKHGANKVAQDIEKL